MTEDVASYDHNNRTSLIKKDYFLTETDCQIQLPHTWIK